MHTQDTDRLVAAASETRVWLERWSEIWGVPDLAAGVRVEFSRRLRRSLGRCRPDTGTIRLHAALALEPEALLREVVCHEAAHAAVYLVHGSGARPHGAEWKTLMRKAGYRPRVRMRLDDLPPALRDAVRIRRLFAHRCPVCGVERLAGRAMNRWRCRACYEQGRTGRLEIRVREALRAVP